MSDRRERDRPAADDTARRASDDTAQRALEDTADQASDDTDRADFTWLATLARRVGRRMFPAAPAAPEGGDQPVEPDGPSGGDPYAGDPYAGDPYAGDPHDAEGDGRTEGTPEGATGVDRRAPPRADLVEWSRRIARLRSVPVALVLVVGVVSLGNHFDGVDWGDDFALYVHQAKSLTVGNAAEVIEQNRFTVDNSGWHSFSPYSYPWGWPILMAPFYRVFGLDYGVFKFLEVVAFCLFLLAFLALVRRRMPLVPALVLTALIGLSPMFVGATDTVVSDLPYLCFVGLTLWWLDRCRTGVRAGPDGVEPGPGILAGPRWALVVLGVLMAYAFNVRREGMVLVLCLVAVHLATLGGMAARARSVRVLRDVDWRTVALPYGVFAVTAVAFQLLLPTVLLPDLPGTGLANVSKHVTYYKDVLAEQVGLKKAGKPVALFGNPTLARQAVALILGLAGVGMVARLLHRFEEDVMLVVYLCGTTFIMLVSPFQDGRYLFTITPLVMYFAYQGLPTTARLVVMEDGPLVLGASIAAAAGLGGLMLLNVGEISHSWRYHRDYHYTVHGPESPDALAMFAAVRDHTRGDDILLFFRARAMTLYTDRVALQGSDLDHLLPKVDWYVMEKGSTYSQALLTDKEATTRRLTKVWENADWVLWRVPPPT